MDGEGAVCRELVVCAVAGLGPPNPADRFMLSRSIGKNGSRGTGSALLGYWDDVDVGVGRRLCSRSGKTRYSCMRPTHRYASAIVRRCHTGVSSSPGLTISASEGWARPKRRSSSSRAFSIANCARVISSWEVNRLEWMRFRSRRMSCPTSCTVNWVSRAMPVHGCGTRCRTKDSPIDEVFLELSDRTMVSLSATKESNISQ